MKIVCGCCEPASALTPLAVENRPSLSAIAYRVGTYSSFRETMLQALAGAPELRGLTTRRSDDYGITVFELWAAVADVLTFYQERYANEAYLRTARFRDSVGRLADLIGYRMLPGVAARASIAFTLDEDSVVAIPLGLKVQSVPESDEQPQTFETLEAITADARWNRLRIFPAPVSASPLMTGDTVLVLDRLEGPAVAASLSPGEKVLLFNDGTSDAVEEKTIASVRNRDDRSIVAWDRPVKQNTWSSDSLGYKFRRTFKWFGHNAPSQYVEPEAPPATPNRITWNLVELTDYGVSAGTKVRLDGKYEDLAPGQKLLIADTGSGGQKTLVTIDEVRQVNRTFGSLSDTVTALTVNPDKPGVNKVPAIDDRRKVVIYEVQGDALGYADITYQPNFSGESVYLPGVAVIDDEMGLGVEVGRTIERGEFQPGVVLYIKEVEKGRAVLLTDDREEPVPATLKDAPTVEPADPADGDFCHLVLSLSVEGTMDLRRSSAVLLGNVTKASHGETVLDEVVGSGDAAATFQKMALKKKPLTHLPGAGPNGLISSLDLRVGGVRWTQVEQLFGQPYDAPVFEARTDDDGASILQFGDGITGATLPTGGGNVTATYRVGVGLDGRVPAESLTTLLAKPRGLSSATNPLPAEGGADPETIDRARQNAPRTVRTFGRIVSLLDFEDEVTASGEVSKALANWVWDGLDRGIHLTIAGQDGGEFSEQARRDLGQTLKLIRDPNHRLIIDNYESVFIEFRAGIGVDPAYDAEEVQEAARQAVLDALSFDNLKLGQPVNLSDLYLVLQDVPGVTFADIDRLMFKQPPDLSLLAFLLSLSRRRIRFIAPFTPDPVQDRLRIFSARPDPNKPGVILPAELASVESPTQDVIIDLRET